MLTPEQIYNRARKRYPEFLRSLCTGTPFFPLTVFGAGMAKPRDFATDRSAIELLQSHSKDIRGFGYEISWVEQTFRRLGVQKIPRIVSFSTEYDFVRALGKQGEVSRFLADYGLIRALCPELQEWAQTKPLEVVEHAGKWQKLLDVCIYLRENPQPGCYIRELPVPVETKFVERHMGILAQILPLAAPLTVTLDVKRFESRFGFRRKQPLVRFRFLDDDIAFRAGFRVNDLALPLDAFCNLPLDGIITVVVENEMTYLTLPTLPSTVAVFGAGDAVALLQCVTWLANCTIVYWGDLDSHGFETLSGLCRAFPRVMSLMMDEETYMCHQEFSVTAAPTRFQGILNLNTAEQQLYDRLVEDGKLLEQEHIPNRYSEPRLHRAISALVKGVPA